MRFKPSHTSFQTSISENEFFEMLITGAAMCRPASQDVTIGLLSTSLARSCD